MTEMTMEEFEQFIEDSYINGRITEKEKTAHLGFVKDTTKEIISISVDVYGKQLETQIIYK